MIIPNELKSILSIINGEMLWICIGTFFVVMYLLISLLTWSFLKPLKYLGIPTAMVGILFFIIRYSLNFVLTLVKIDMKIIEIILPNILKPVLLIGIWCTVIGVVMIVLYAIINSKKEKSIVNNEKKLEEL